MLNKFVVDCRLPWRASPRVYGQVMQFVQFKPGTIAFSACIFRGGVVGHGRRCRRCPQSL